MSVRTRIACTAIDPVPSAGHPGRKATVPTWVPCQVEAEFFFIMNDSKLPKPRCLHHLNLRHSGEAVEVTLEEFLAAQVMNS